ncbi:M1 family aminopeptidase [Aureivirga marina]|uniref:M1 family aminopeptidase n=1 Tax=Aureivirga marina TaxID=1182451 RepID=UPI0018CBDF33|nr:M1 family aminopeptidase [Aureivirga marina]
MKQFYILILLLFVLTKAKAQEKSFYKDVYLEDLIKNEGRKFAFRNTNSETNHTSNYDLTYHKLDWKLNPNAVFAHIEGTVTSDFTAKEEMSTIAFDLADNMTVTEIKQGENELLFTHFDDILTIYLSETLQIGESSTVEVTYNGYPESGSGFGAFTKSSHNGTPIIWTLSEPYGAKQWWPCKQDLIDKVENIDIFVTTPSEFVVASNGLKISEEISGLDKTTHWKHDYPIPAYLVAIAITNYTIYTELAYEGTTNEFPIDNYVYPESLELAQEKTPVTVDIMELFGDLFEMYPFKEEKYGHAQFGWGGGMEHTTMSFMGNFNRGLIAHELAHQWFGDKITCGSWSDLWVNEGFATYSNALVIENFDGEEAFKNWRINKTGNIKALPDGSVYVHENDTINESRLFSSRLTYNKGAMLLHMVRKHIGDEDFFQGIKNFLNDDNLAYDYAKSEQVIEHFEATSGEDLTEFFNDWLYGQGYPLYSSNWSQNGNDVEIELMQGQSDPSVDFFEIRLPVEFIGENGESHIEILNNTENNQLFTVTIDFPVSSVVIDPNFDYILKKETNLSVENISSNVIDLNLFPNPTDGILYVKENERISIKSIQIYDNTQKELKNVAFDNKTINIKNYESGLYFVKIITDKGVVSYKILKK